MQDHALVEKNVECNSNYINAKRKKTQSVSGLLINQNYAYTKFISSMVPINLRNKEMIGRFSVI
jgi:hypothetical protein